MLNSLLEEEEEEDVIEEEEEDFVSIEELLLELFETNPCLIFIALLSSPAKLVSVSRNT